MSLLRKPAISHLSAHFVQLLGLRICDRAAQTAADNSDLLETLELALLAERTDEIVQAVASFSAPSAIVVAPPPGK